ncbi:MAG TPA: hypothetical protein V6D20_17975, partial [Candidatus Obscuribacterales bacterium]
CATGPYTSVSCTLTLMGNRTRKKTTMSTQTSNYAWDGSFEDDRFNYNIGGIQSIATSSAQNDSGLFELRISGDERYLPFEGAGVISQWRLELPSEFRQFDYNTITDVILHINYTAREGGDALKSAATDHVRGVVDQTIEGVFLMRMFSAKHEFPGEWHQFLHPEQEDTPHTLELNLNPERFPFLFQGKTVTINRTTLYLKLKEADTAPDAVISSVTLTPPDAQSGNGISFDSATPDHPLPWAQVDSESEVTNSSTWTLTAEDVTPDQLEDIFVVCQYSVSN